MKVRHLFAFLIALAAVSPETAARAEDPPKPENLPPRQATYIWDKNPKTGQVLFKTNFTYRDVVDASVQQKLGNGIPTDIVLRAYLFREGDKNPVALAVRTCHISYELWEEVYRIKVTTTGEKDQDRAVLNVEGVLRTCAQVTDLVVADRVLLTGNKPFFLGVIAEVNPVSAEMLAQLQQWVARPAGSTGIGPGDALFGSVLGLFVKQLGNADKTVRFRTQSVMPP